jgi:hypothetical protein
MLDKRGIAVPQFGKLLAIMGVDFGLDRDGAGHRALQAR